MMHTKSESDITSLAPSSPSRSPKRPVVYYVQSPSRDSHDGDKSSSMHPTPTCNTPIDSPSHPSFGRHSRNSSASRFSGIFRSSSGRKGGRKRNDKGWPECDVIMEEGKYEDDDDAAFVRRFQAMLGFLAFVLLFTVFCLIIWGAARGFKAEVTVKSFAIDDFYIGAGADNSGVPTNMLTVNGSLRISIYNPATFFGIHVSSKSINLLYSDISVATGQLKKHYQPRKSHRIVLVNLEGTKVPLYGAGSTFSPSNNNAIQVPLTLQLEVKSRSYVVGSLVKTKHRVHITCPLVIDSTRTKPIKFTNGTCTYV